MLRTVVWTLAVLLCTTSPGAAQQDPGPVGMSDYEARQTWFSRDKAYHFAISAAGSAGVYALGREAGLDRWQAVAASAVVVGTAGVLKEILRGQRNDLLTRDHLSRKDLVWDAAGIVVGISVTDLLYHRRRTAPE